MTSTSPVGNQAFAWRLWTVSFVMILAMGVLLYRLLGLQVFQATDWLGQAVENYTTTVSVQPPRGIIYDRNGYILAGNIASYNIVITPADLPDSDADIQNIYRDLAKLIDVPATQGTVEDAKLVAECVPGPGISQLVELGDSLAPYRPVKIKCNVDEETARTVRERAVDWPGVSVEIDPIRDYPTGSLTANVIGFLGPIPATLEGVYRARGFVPNRDKIGYAGVEAALDPVLIGVPGKRVVQVDVAGKELRNLEPPISPISGNNLKLTLDTRLQAAAEAVLLTEIQSWNDYYGQIRISSGVVIAMNPRTGEILAMVTYPTYENNRMSRFIPAYYYDQLSEDPRRPLLNNAIQAEYPPGSVFKLSTATGAFNEGVVTLSKIIQTPGKLELCEKFSPNESCTDANTRPFVDWVYNIRGVINEAGFGQLDFLHCIAYSSNVCFYKLGGGFEDEIEEGLGIFRLGEYARALGYGAASGIQLIGEQDGLIPSPQWKRINQGENWSTGDTYIASVGQGYVIATPLQVLMSGATIANDGKLMQPTIAREVTDSEGKVTEVWFNPEDFSLWSPFQSVPDDRDENRAWINLDDATVVTDLPDGSYQISPFVPNLKWDLTVTPRIRGYSCEDGYCSETGEMKIVQPSTIEAVQTGMRMAVTDPQGTLNDVFAGFPIAVAGKTGTAEYCDDVALKANRCQFGEWPTHSWTLAYAPFEDPEIIIMAFMYNGGEGASVAGPIVGRVMEAYFELKAIDIAQGEGG
ncbi:MAG: penicillin-binding transpeptidase domain-containing protein [Chloroflexota bacterium]